MTTPLQQHSKQIIKIIFFSLNKEEIPYVVLRNYEGLPDVVRHDIDILVNEEHFDQFFHLFIQIIKSEGWTILQRQSRYAFISFTILSPESFSIQESLKWDVWAPITWRGIPWIDSKAVLSNRKLHTEHFYIPSPGAESAILLLKDLVQGKSIQQPYYEKIQRYYLEDPVNFSTVLFEPFGSTVLNDLNSWIRAGEWQKFERESSHLKYALIKRSLTTHPLRLLIASIRFTTGHIQDYLLGRNRLTVSFIGPDGSGKSTISYRLMDAMKDVCEDWRYYHGRFGIIPPLANFLSGTKDVNSSSEKHAPKKQGGILVGGMMAYYSFDFFLGYFLIKIHRRQSDLVIFDRFFYDYVIQPGPFSPDSLFNRVLLRLIPKPDIVIFPHASAETIHQRKPELSIKEISRQIDICFQIIRESDNSYIVDNSQPIDSVVEKIRLKLLEIMRNRAVRNNAR